MVSERGGRSTRGTGRLSPLGSAALTTLGCWVATVAYAQEGDRSRLYEPVFRVSKKATATGDSNLGGDAALPTPAAVPVPVPVPVEPQVTAHPLDPALDTARESLEFIEQSIRDYSCTLVKRERVNGQLMDYEFMNCKVRHPGLEAGKVVPFSVYLNFLKPDNVRGREVIFVEGHNAGKMVAHEGGFKGRFLPTVNLLPTSALAMRGCRYPITEIGVMTLTRRLIEKGERDQKHGQCHVRMDDGAKVCERNCMMIEVLHERQKPQYDFHLARIFVDHELKIPIRYEAYGWPTQPGASPPLLEEYTYMDLKVNVGLTDSDFDSKNSRYRF